MFRLSERFHEAVHLFNKGRYFECHEVLEELWRAEPTSWRLLYQGILQVAVGCYHLTVRHNRHGAVSKLWAGIEKLQQFPAVVDGVDIHDLREQVAHFLREVEKMDDARLRSTRAHVRWLSAIWHSKNGAAPAGAAPLVSGGCELP